MATNARNPCTRPAECVDRHPGWYLTNAYRLGTDREGRVGTGHVGDSLGVAPSSVTEMFDRLGGGTLVDYEEHRGVELTDRGRDVAAELTRRRCLVQRFFGSELGVELDAETGCRIGYVVAVGADERLGRLVEVVEANCRDRENDDDCPCEAVARR